MAKISDDDGLPFDAAAAAKRLAEMDAGISGSTQAASSSSRAATFCRYLGIAMAVLGALGLVIAFSESSLFGVACFLGTILSGGLIFSFGTGLQYLFDIREAVLEGMKGNAGA